MNNIKIPKETIKDFCQRNNIKRLSLFGSALHGKMTKNSDVDMLVEFLPDTHIGFFKLAGLKKKERLITAPFHFINFY